MHRLRLVLLLVLLLTLLFFACVYIRCRKSECERDLWYLSKVLRTRSGSEFDFSEQMRIFFSEIEF